MNDPHYRNVTCRVRAHKYRLRMAWLIELIRLAIVPPACMLLAIASSSALWVTEASKGEIR